MRECKGDQGATKRRPRVGGGGAKELSAAAARQAALTRLGPLEGPLFANGLSVSSLETRIVTRVSSLEQNFKLRPTNSA